MTIILAADSDWAIGRDGGLLAHIPEDMKFFRETTANSTVVMGRKTWESIGAKPLPGRVNCVISRSVKQLDGAQVFGSVEEFLGFAEKAEGKVFVIGGGVSRAGDVLFAPLREHFKVYAFKSCRETPIVPAILGNDAGIYGSVRLIVGE